MPADVWACAGAGLLIAGLLGAGLWLANRKRR
jgi:hypothetical protein